MLGKTEHEYRGHKVEIVQLEEELFEYNVDGNIGGEHTSTDRALRSAETMIDNIEDFAREAAELPYTVDEEELRSY